MTKAKEKAIEYLNSIKTFKRDKSRLFFIKKEINTAIDIAIQETAKEILKLLKEKSQIHFNFFDMEKCIYIPIIDYLEIEQKFKEVKNG